ncbi:MAG: histidinol-phosphatase [Erysipelotrichaceae bacterium]|nr:histidinol-phosphatase [Erysipelotrichaceae bacterium]
MKQVNFHTHTSRCMHAVGKDEEYVIQAIRNGFDTLGFSDHCPWNYASTFRAGMRMPLTQFSEYKESVLSLKEKYKEQITIYLGLEAEYFPAYMDWMESFCRKESVDYLIFGNHYHTSDEISSYYPYAGKHSFDTYIDDCLQGMKTGLYSYLAHPELIMMNEGLEWDEHVDEQFHRICALAKELDLPLEYNAAGMMANHWFGEAYPHHRFWQIASQYQNKALVGMDAHDPNNLSEDIYREAIRQLSSYNVEIIDTIRLDRFKG